MGSGQSREYQAFAQQVAAPLAAGQRLRPCTRAYWCSSITRILPEQRMQLLALVISPFCENRPWRGKHHGAMWAAFHGAVRQWAAATVELQKLWYHHRDDVPRQLWRAGAGMQSEMLTGQILRLPVLAGQGGSSRLPAHLWCLVADWTVDSLEAAFAWRHVSGGEWGQGLQLLLQARWPQLPLLSLLLPWLETRTMTVACHARRQAWDAPLVPGAKRKRVTLRWRGGMRTQVPTEASLEELGVPWTVREIWCDLTETARPSALLHA